MSRPTVDPKLVRDAQQGDADARQAVLSTVALRYPVAMGRDDLCQEVLLQVHLGLDRIQQPEHFTAWVYGVLRNCAANRQRASRVRKELLSEDLDALGLGAHPPAFGAASPRDPEQLTSAQQACDHGMRALAALPDPLREIYALYVEEHSVTEIAEMLGIPRGTAASRLRRAHGLLRRQLEHLRTSAPSGRTRGGQLHG